MSTTTAAPACTQPGCAGHVVDGYCDVCGMPGAEAADAAAPAAAGAAASGACQQPGCTGTIVDGYCDVCGTPGRRRHPERRQRWRRRATATVTTAAACRPRSSRSSRRASRTARPAPSPAARGTILDGYCDTCGASGDSDPLGSRSGPAGVSSSPSTMSRASNRLASIALGSARAGVAGQHQDAPGALGVAAAARRAARRRPDDDPAGSGHRRQQGDHEGPGRPGGQAVLLELRQPRRPRQGRQPRPHDRLLRQVPPGVLVRPQAQARRPRRRPVRGGRLPGPRWPRLDLPRPRQERVEPLDRPQGPAQLRRPRRPGRGDRRAALPRPGLAPAHRGDLQLRHARRRRLHRHGVRRRHVAEIPSETTDAQGRPLRPDPRRPGARVHHRDPAGVPVPPRPGPGLLRLQARQPHPGRRHAQAHRPRRGAPDRRRGLGDLRDGGVPGARGAGPGDDRRLGHLHDRPHARSC